MSDSGEPFVSRWSRLKQGGAQDAVDEPATPTAMEDEAPGDELPVLTDADMPPVETLGDDDDYSGFLGAGVSEALRRVALRRLFRSPKFNAMDGLDDYAEDFTHFAPLGDIITADMKHRLERLLAEKDADEAATEADDLAVDDRPAEYGSAPDREHEPGGYDDAPESTPLLADDETSRT